MKWARFNRALLKVWLGDHPAQADLKTAMLGGRTCAAWGDEETRHHPAAETVAFVLHPRLRALSLSSRPCSAHHALSACSIDSSS
jgi:hypothetical protein